MAFGRFPLANVSNAALFAGPKIAADFLGPDIDFSFGAITEFELKTIQANFDSLYSYANVRADDFAKTFCLFASEHYITGIDIEIVKWFGINELWGSVPGKPLLFKPLELYVMPANPIFLRSILKGIEGRLVVVEG